MSVGDPEVDVWGGVRACLLFLECFFSLKPSASDAEFACVCRSVRLVPKFSTGMSVENFPFPSSRHIICPKVFTRGAAAQVKAFARR